MIDMFTLAFSHGLLVLLILRVVRTRDPASPEPPKYTKPLPVRKRV